MSKKGDVIAIRGPGIELILDNETERLGHIRTYDAAGKPQDGEVSGIDGILKFGYWEAPPKKDDDAIAQAVATVQAAKR
jgi:hypothetical protein